MNLFHGTNKTAAAIINTAPPGVDVNLGGGELGKGFYLGDNLSLAITWAKGKYSKTASVLQFDVNNTNYAKLSLKQMNHRDVKSAWRQLRKNGTTHTHVFGFDVVFGPLGTNSYAAQYKFESNSAESLLNSSTINVIL
jgi:hypothetical protein